MHIITQKAVAAFNANYNFCQSNTAVVVDDNTTRFLLWGNRIAWKKGGRLYFCLCGWDTTTTCERLRGLGLAINHKRGKLFYNNQQINDCAVYMIDDNDNAIQQ